MDSEIVATKISRAKSDAHSIRHSDMRRHAWPTSTSDLGRYRSNERVLAFGIRAADAFASASQHPVTTCKVISAVMMERTNNGKLVCDPGLQREKFCDFHSWNVGGDWLPDATIFRRSFRLHVVSVHMSRAAIEPEQNDRGVFGGFACRLRLLFCRQDLRQANAGHAGNSELHKTSARTSIAIGGRLTGVNSKHDLLLSVGWIGA